MLRIIITKIKYIHSKYILILSYITLGTTFFCNGIPGKALGGTGNLHGMMYMRANPWDYNQWAKLGIKGWSYDELLPYFKKSENNIQIGDIYKKVSISKLKS